VFAWQLYLELHVQTVHIATKVCLTPLSEICQLYHGVQFYCWMNREYPEKTTDLTEVNGKIYLTIF
jgi:hypothetical protein